ncbi:DNA replication initiation control protein YabA [Streptococcus sp. zg-JUN1979]|uniref:DNA replication initiation control protein YabA n=1 Tax=Streptococcus sp. zg-JUN1979 TaxID=3391450 RepID=UPI0039A501CF
MDKKELFDAFDDLTQNLIVTLAEADKMKKQFETLMEQNTQLHLENIKLRERLGQLEHEKQAKQSTQGKAHLEGIYEDGFHICNSFYGQRRENEEECMFCQELLDRG